MRLNPHQAQFSVMLAASIFALSAAVVSARADLPAFISSTPQGTSCLIWELVGGIPVNGANFFLTTDENGRISGRSEQNYSYDTTSAFYRLVTATEQLSGSVVGKIKSRDTVHKVKLRVDMTGTVTLIGWPWFGYGPVVYSYPLTKTWKIVGEIEPAGTLQGTLTSSQEGFGAYRKHTDPITVDVTPDVANDGTWTLNLDVASPDGKKLQGTGEVVLATGRIVDLTAGGKYKLKADKSNLKLVSEQGSKIALKALTADASTMTLVDGQLKGKVMGQKWKGSFPCP